MQKTHWRSSTSSREVWWLDNGWSQSLQWGMWIKKQSPVRCRGSGSCHSVDSILSLQNKDFTRGGEEFTKVPRAVTQAISYLYRQFIGVCKPCEDLWWHHRPSTPHRSETHGIAERALRRVKKMNFSSTATIRLGWKMLWLIRWNAFAICEKFKTSWQMGKLHMKDCLENHSKGQFFVWSNGVECHPISAREQSILHQFGKTILPGIFLRYALIALDFGKEMLWLRIWKTWKSWTHQKFILEESTRKKNWYHKRKKNSYSQLQMAQQNCQEDTTNSENPHFGGNNLQGAKTSVKNFEANQKVLNRQNQKMTLKPVPTSGRFKVTSSHVITWNPRVQLYLPKGKTFPVPLKYIDVTRSTHTNLGVMKEKCIDDCRNVDSNRNLCIVKDDSGTYAVWAEQGSFASQMTAAKVINGCHCKINRLWRTSSWCRISLPLSKIGGRSEIAQNSWVRISSLGTHWRSCGTSRKEIHMDTHSQDCCGKDKFEGVLPELGREK